MCKGQPHHTANLDRYYIRSRLKYAGGHALHRRRVLVSTTLYYTGLISMKLLVRRTGQAALPQWQGVLACGYFGQWWVGPSAPVGDTTEHPERTPESEHARCSDSGGLSGWSVVSAIGVDGADLLLADRATDITRPRGNHPRTKPLETGACKEVRGSQPR